MKKLLLLLLVITTAIQAQTTFSNEDIAASAGNRYETLLTNTEALYGDGTIQSYLQKIGMRYSGYEYADYKENEYNFYRFEKSTLIGNENQTYVYIKIHLKPVKEYEYPMATKVEIWGDWRKVVEFYCGYWSRSLNFDEVKPGEVVSTRFLTDIATLTFPDAETAKITVVTARDYYAD